MGISAFEKNAVVIMDNKHFILLRKVEDTVWQLEDERTGRIQELTDEELRDRYVQGRLYFQQKNIAQVCTGQSNIGKSTKTLTDNDWDEIKLRRAYVVATLDLPNTERCMKPYIIDVWLKLKQPAAPPNWNTVYRWKRQYIESRKDSSVLLTNNAGKGNRTARYPKEVIRLANKAIDLEYLTTERKTIQDALDKSIVLVNDENKLLPQTLALPRPTRRLIKRLIEAIPAFERCIARHGRTAAIKRFRSVKGHHITNVPLERAEIDHTLMDLMVIDDETGLPLGRPWLTICIDVNTRNVLGIYIGFEPPSFLTVARCLRMAFLPKTRLKEDYPRIENVWDAFGVMRELVVDNGLEFHSKSLERACFMLGIEIHYSARKTPWYKGKVERFIGTLNRAIAHGTPGTTFSNIIDKDDYDPAKHAIVSLETLKEVVHMWIVDVYHQRPHRTLKEAPAVAWRSRISPEDIHVPDDPDQLDAILGRIETRVLTHKGIELGGLFYNSPEMTRLRQEQGEKLDVELSIDDADLGNIIVIFDGDRLFKVPALAYEYANGLSRWQHNICKRFAAQNLARYDSIAWLEAKARIGEIINEELLLKKRRTRTRVARYKENESLPKKAEEPVTDNDPIASPHVSTPESQVAADIENTDTSWSSAMTRKIAPVYRKRVGSENQSIATTSGGEL